MNYANLNKLATFLEHNSIPTFAMESYVEGMTRDDLRLYVSGVLNVIPPKACAVGCGPAAGVFATPNDYTPYGEFMWGVYQQKFVTERHQVLWIAAPQWNHIDPTQSGAAARIRYLLVHGHPPQGFEVPNPDMVPLYQEFVR